MKKLIINILIAVLFLTVSGCSLTGITSSPSTQADNGTLEATTTAQQETTIDQNNVQPTDVQPAKSKMLKVTLYFATEDNSAIKEENREVQVVDGAILKACVEALMEGPKTETLHRTIPDGTRLLGINRKDNVAIVDFSKEYNTSGDVEEIVERVSIVNTLIGISGIEKVIIRVEGKDLVGPSGKPFGEMGKVVLDSNGKPAADGT